MTSATEQLRKLNAGILEEDVARTLRRRKNKSGLVLEVLEANGLSLAIPWKSVIQAIREKMQKHRELRVDKTTLEDMGYVFKIVHDSFYCYCHLVQKFNPAWFESLERIHDAQARARFVNLISPLVAFTHKVWKNVPASDVKQAVDYESLEAVIEAVDAQAIKESASKSMVQIETAREREVRTLHARIVEGLQSGAATTAVIPASVHSFVGSDVSERIEHRKGVSDELSLLPAKLYASLIELENDWQPRMRDIAKAERLKSVWSRKIVPFIQKLAECSALFEKDVVVKADEDIEAEMKSWNSAGQTSEIAQYIQHLRDVLKSSLDALPQNATDAVAVETLRGIMRSSEDRLLNERERKNRELCESTAREYTDVQKRILERTVVRGYVHNVGQAIDVAVRASEEAMREVETLLAETADPGVSPLAHALRDVDRVHEAMKRFSQDAAEKLKELDDAKAVRGDEDTAALRAAMTEWKDVFMKSENATYALYIIRRLQSDPLRFESVLEDEHRVVTGRSRIPQEILRKRIQAAKAIEDACTRYVRNAAKTYAVPIAAHFAEHVTAACESIHKSIEEEIALLNKNKRSFHGVGAIRRPLDARSGTAQSLLRKPIVVPVIAAESHKAEDCIRAMRVAMSAPGAEDVVGLSAPEMRVIVSEVMALHPFVAHEKAVDVCTLWDALHFFFFGSMFLDFSVRTE